MLKASNKFFCFETHQKAILYGSLKVLHLFFFCKNKPGIKITMSTFGLPFISFFLSFYLKKKKKYETLDCDLYGCQFSFDLNLPLGFKLPQQTAQ